MKTTWLTDGMLNHAFRASPIGPVAVYAGLIDIVTDKEAGAVQEITYTGYARQAITFGSPTAGGGGRQVSNSVAITFPQATGGTLPRTAIAIGVWDNSGSGNLMAIVFLGDDPPIIATVTDSGGGVALLTTGTAHGLVDDQTVRLEQIAGAAWPTGFGWPGDETAGVTAYVSQATANTLRVSVTAGGISEYGYITGGGCMIIPFTGVAINLNDTPSVPIGGLVLQDD